jgi:hypothetical protein
MIFRNFFKIIFLVYLCIYSKTIDCIENENRKKNVPIKIIEEPSKSNAQYIASLQTNNKRLFSNLNLNSELDLKSKYDPARLTGPIHLIDELNGNCFERIEKK